MSEGDREGDYRAFPRVSEITRLAERLAELELRHRVMQWRNIANCTLEQLKAIQVEDALLQAEINDTRLMLAIEQQGRDTRSEP